MKTVFLAEPELSALLAPTLVGDLKEMFDPIDPFEPFDVVSGPGVVDGMMICKLPFSAAAIAAETTLCGAVVEKFEEKFVKNSPARGTFRVLAAAAAMTEAGGADETARSAEVDFSDKCGATVDNSDVEKLVASNDDGGDGERDDSEEGDAAIDNS